MVHESERIIALIVGENENDVARPGAGDFREGEFVSCDRANRKKRRQGQSRDEGEERSHGGYDLSQGKSGTSFSGRARTARGPAVSDRGRPVCGLATTWNLATIATSRVAACPIGTCRTG